MISRVFSPVFARNANCAVRRYSAASSSAREKYLAELEHTRAHAKDATELWRKISLYVALPSVLLGVFNAKRLMDEHHEHEKHHPREWVAYAYLKLRNKPFPWTNGDQGLFYNPKVNLEPVD
ncbi:Cytochrome c oxidase subunit 6A [Entomophthora muscae]|uniref:Cytochrome c oxidase subunit 6A n=1 Tax=Entomophthora muscae TaxID=34485 RepID=A0ACC2RS85_9FUNG|nr:Cytochrome c oxidase subunit 6A [Entomophthora muscae]